jgi:hypothetical protein
MAENRKTTIKLLRPEDAWHPAIGAPRGNRNAAKPLSTLEARVRALRRRARAAVRQAWAGKRMVKEVPDGPLS